MQVNGMDFTEVWFTKIHSSLDRDLNFFLIFYFDNSTYNITSAIFTSLVCLLLCIAASVGFTWSIQVCYPASFFSGDPISLLTSQGALQDAF